MKFIITIFVLTCILGCNSPSTSDAVTADPSSSPTPEQGFTGHVYAAYGGPACEANACTPRPPMREPMPNIHVVAVEPDTYEIFAETISQNDGSYQVSVEPGDYRICLKWETGMTCSATITIPKNTYRVEDFDVGQG